MQAPGELRIGELSRRVGVSPELLRAWERRYGLLQPSRSPGGFRLYSAHDESRVRAMQALVALGLSAAEAASAALREAVPAPVPESVAGPAEAIGQLCEALELYDEAGAHAILDRLLAVFGTGTVLTEVVLPVLALLGERWQAGQIEIAQEHFASNLLRGRLLGLARRWGGGGGRIAVLACPPGEWHDLALLIFGVGLREAGWRIAFLGADTPIPTVRAAGRSLRADTAVLTAVLPARLEAVETELAALGRETRLAVGGPGVDSPLAGRLQATLLTGDPVAAATAFAASFVA